MQALRERGSKRDMPDEQQLIPADFKALADLDADLDYSADCDYSVPSYPDYDFEKDELLNNNIRKKRSLTLEIHSIVLPRLSFILKAIESSWTEESTKEKFIPYILYNNPESTIKTSLKQSIGLWLSILLLPIKNTSFYKPEVWNEAKLRIQLLISVPAVFFSQSNYFYFDYGSDSTNRDYLIVERGEWVKSKCIYIYIYIRADGSRLIADWPQPMKIFSSASLLCEWIAFLQQALLIIVRCSQWRLLLHGSGRLDQSLAEKQIEPS